MNHFIQKAAFKALVLGPLTLVFMVSCSPRDNHVKNLKQRLMEGELIVLDKPGDRLPTCLDYESDWQDLRIHENDYDQLVMSSLLGAMGNGYKNCHRVGNRVFISNDKIKANGSLGWVEITGVGLVKLDAINKNANKDLRDYEDKKKLLLNGKVANNFDETVERLASKAEPKHQGIVQITMFKYVLGSSALETQIRSKYSTQNDLEQQLSNGKLITISEEGKKLPSCSSSEELWSDFRVHKSEFPLLKEGSLKTLIKKGSKNCHSVGQVIPVTSKGLEGDLGKVKITELKLLSLENLKKQKQLIQGEGALSNFDENIQRLEKEMSADKHKIVSLIYVEYLGAQ